MPAASSGITKPCCHGTAHLDFTAKHSAHLWLGGVYGAVTILFTAGYGADNQHESVVFSHALLASTEKLKVIAAILPVPWTPSVAAKQLATIDQLTAGRVAVNIVSGWFKGEFQAIGEPWLEHDERYRRSEEFIQALKGI